MKTCSLIREDGHVLHVMHSTQALYAQNTYSFPQISPVPTYGRKQKNATFWLKTAVKEMTLAIILSAWKTLHRWLGWWHSRLLTICCSPLQPSPPINQPEEFVISNICVIQPASKTKNEYTQYWQRGKHNFKGDAEEISLWVVCPRPHHRCTKGRCY